MDIKEVVVVEGKEDTAAVRRAVGADTIETGGSAIDERVLRRVELAQERRGVIVLTDPDSPGERIRKIVAERVPAAKHAFLTRQQARGRDGIGVEHASDEAIREALARARGADTSEAAAAAAEMSASEAAIAWSDLLDAGLLVHASSARRRERMGELLGIGYGNGKTFYKRLHVFRITREEFVAALEQLEREEGSGEW